MSQEKLIEMGKKYKTRDGADVRILTIDRKHPSFPVVALLFSRISKSETTRVYTKYGYAFADQRTSSDLIEVSPWEDFKIDEKVIVWNNDNPGRMRNRYFAGVALDGRPQTWVNGGTSWSNYTRSKKVWDNCIRAEDATESQSEDEANKPNLKTSIDGRRLIIPQLNSNHKDVVKCLKFSCTGLSCYDCAINYNPSRLDSVIAESIRLHGEPTNE